MNEEISLGNAIANGDLASFIDAENQPEFQKAFNANQQPVEVTVEEVPASAEGPTLLSENKDRIAQRRQQERFQRVEPGKLFHGWLKTWELKKANNGSVFLRFDCTLECNNWRMTHTRFLPKSALDSTEAIASARDKILLDFGYDFSKQQFDGIRLFEIGSYAGNDGKDHLKVERVYTDTADYNSYQQWKWNRDHAPKKQWHVDSAPLPE